MFDDSKNQKFLFLFCFLNTEFLCVALDVPGTNSVDLDDLKLRVLPAFALPPPPVLGLKAWDATIQPTLTFFLLCYSLVLLQPERSICLLRISLWPKVCPV